MKKIILLLAIIVVGVLPTFGQNFGVYYSVSFPTGDLSDFISKTSFRGVNADYHFMLTDNIGVGVSTGWNVFYEDLDYDTYTVGNTSLSGKQYRYSNHIPMLASGAYFLKPNEKINPFAKLGIGTIYTRRNTDMGQYTQEQVAWNFAMVPEIGVLYGVGIDKAVNLSLKYYNGFQAGSELDKAQSYFSLNIGFVF